jgi:hypothetical protein
MRLFLANLLLKHTKCSVRHQGTTVSLVWQCDLDTFSWSLHASKNMRVIVSHNNTLKLIKHYSKHHKYYD